MINPVTIVFICRDELVRGALGELLRASGARVHATASMLEAIRFANATLPEVFLVDGELPTEELRTFANAKHGGPFNQLPVIILSRGPVATRMALPHATHFRREDSADELLRLIRQRVAERLAFIA